ncbi:Transmembrane secretion effector [Sporobacter termitidis DSM 10068]|uniref:Transmembrane secretion effector n=1 Tax=Sporobacter termitidis DSM 10068 TaxID=1123282 RepID=A0A1M5WUR0_9FIRM|nr:MFS transporter [Sporobacter termitidis]SHH91339.1 Transmembrane secretion effector [Sporobacter termitidis DSM 10068]
MRTARTERLFLNSRFLLFFMSQNFVSCGAFVQVVAVAKLIVSMTNSGLLAGFSIVCAPLPGVLLSLVAGGLGDRFKARNLLLLCDILRGGLVISFSFCRTVPSLFIVMMLSGLLDVLYSPARNKTLAALLTKDQLLRGNSLLSGGYGVVSLIMPALTGVVLGRSGAATVFFVGGAFYFLSALTLSYLHVGRQPVGPPRSAPGEVLRGLRYCFDSAPLRQTILTMAVVDFAAVSVNIAFYSYAFDTLRVTSAYWGLLLSVLYGMNVFAMLFLVRHQKTLGGNSFAFANLFLAVVALVWCFNSTTRSLPAILGTTAVEGFSTALSATLLVTTLLKTARADYTARVSGVRDLCSSAAKLLGIGVTYILMHFFDAQAVFIAGAGAILLSVIFRALSAPLVKTGGRVPGRALKGDASHE